MRTVYVVCYNNERYIDGRVIRGAYLDEDEARKEAEGFGIFGKDGCVVPVNLYGD